MRERRRAAIDVRIRGIENSKSTRVTDAKGAKLKQWFHDFVAHPWVVCKEAADGADGRAECGKRRISYMYGYGYECIPGYGHLPPRFVPRVVRAEWAWIPTSRAAAAGALVVC